ncbi:MAG TPA: hypothetical protein VHK24_05595 [Steroidobacter sp.]|jgi:hypothetical protein|nr:hypothetical protein [Steroidobacter sp.]
MPKQNKKALQIAAGAAVSLTAVAFMIVVLMIKRIVTFQMALLMLVAVLALYFGFGVLIAVYRFVAKLE